jgi:hypothetical protein
MKVYYASILDYQNVEILNLKYTTSAKHSAFLAVQYVKDTPPACGFKIHFRFIDKSVVVDLMNK